MITLDLKKTGRMPAVGVEGFLNFAVEDYFKRFGGVYINKRHVPEHLDPKWTERSHYELPAPLMGSVIDENGECLWLRPNITPEVLQFKRHWEKYERELEKIKANDEETINRHLKIFGIHDSFFKREPKLHQKAGLAFFLLSLYIGSGHICLFDDMRTGKTKQAIDIARFLLNTDRVGAVLVIVPNSIKNVWFNELRLDAPQYAMLTNIIRGTKLKKKALWEGAAFFYIVNYESARADEQFLLEWQERKKGKGWLLICDESHKLKNPKAQQTKVVMGLRPNYSVFMTGTPIANRPEDAFSMTHFVCPNLLGKSVWDFQQQFAERGGYKGKEIIGYSDLSEVRNRVGAVSLRRLRKDVVFDKTVYQTRSGEMKGEQAKVYESMRKSLWAEVMGETGVWTRVRAQNGFTKALRLYQISDGYLSSGPEDVTWFQPNWKVKELDEFIEEYIDSIGKVVIFTRFVPVIKNLVARYAEYGALHIRGQMGDLATENMYKFQRNPKHKVMIAQIQTCEGRGFQPARFAVMYDKWASPHLNQQAKDRIVGLMNPVVTTVISLVTMDAIDERLEYILELKREYADAITGDTRENELWLPSMDKETLLYLLARPEEAEKYKEKIG